VGAGRAEDDVASGAAARLSRTGALHPGAAADVTCIDPERIRDTATYERPRSLPEGIPYVVVNGRIVVDDGRHTGELAGRTLRSPARGKVR
jgi:N-acyl-D-aspartate/D-glutamate deacylase